MKKSELLALVESLSLTKGIDKELVFQAMEAALAMTTRKRHANKYDVRVSVDRKTGEYKTYKQRTVVEDDDFDELVPESQLKISEAKALKLDIVAEDIYEEPIESLEFGRIDAQTWKQVFIGEVRRAERINIVERYKEQVGTLVSGVVKKVTRDHVILDLGNNVEAILYRNETISGEAFRMNDRVRGYLYDVHFEARGPQLFVSRTRPEMLAELFRMEVPEISEQVIEIKSAARDPGARSKIAVKTNDGRIDPIGACVGMRGSRVQAVSNELSGERIDIVLWDDNPAQLVINAMAPAEVESIVVDEDSHAIDVAVNQDNYAQAIGRSGQNVRLASELSGWELNVMTTEEAEQKSAVETESACKTFMEQLDLDEDIAKLMVEEGFTSVEEIAYVPLEELLDIEGLDEEIVEELRNRAKDYMLTKALADQEEEISANEPAEDLLSMRGMTDELAHQLAEKGIRTMEDLAEMAVDDIVDIEGLNEEKAAELIMTAREPWFNED